MIVEVKVNELPESVEDGTLVTWHKQPGDEVKADDPLAEIETDKVVLKSPRLAPALWAAIAQEGRNRQARRCHHDHRCRWHQRGQGQARRGSRPRRRRQRLRKRQQEDPPSPPPSIAPAPAPLSPAPPAGSPRRTANGEAEMDGLAPAVRRLLEEHKLSPSDVTGSGPRGRITKEDVLRHLEHSPQLASNIGEAPTVVEISDAPAAPSESGALALRPTTRTKMTRLRARIAERMLEAQRSAAILTTFNEINMQALMDLRRNYKDAFQTQHGVKLGIMGFFVKACAEALRRYPVVNASVDGDDIVYHGYFDIGVAVSTTRGLVVPVLRDADRMSLAEIERAIAGFGSRGEEGKLGIDELTGGTFTISNGGVFGSMLSTPILNPPQSAILGLHRIEPRPVAEGDKVVIRPMMYLALSYDHRIVDGREAVLFLVAIKELIEDPTRFILRV
jgi:2-oxoglutarate dehydrogenase E2 component (dihydrolipoamide succinyltransferase)